MVDKPCVIPGYFKAMGMPVLRGRDFTESDSATTPGVVIVSQTVARTLWPGQDPIGKRISMEDEPKPEDWLTVVGVVGDVKQQGLAKGSEPAIYLPYLQVSQPFFLNHMTLADRDWLVLVHISQNDAHPGSDALRPQSRSHHECPVGEGEWVRKLKIRV